MMNRAYRMLGNSRHSNLSETVTSEKIKSPCKVPTFKGSRPAGPTRRLLMVTYDFPPSLEMGGRACAQIARYLPEYGWEPIVLTLQYRYLERVGAEPEPASSPDIVRTRVIPHPLFLYKSLKRLGFGFATSRTDGQCQHKGGTFRRWLLSLLSIPDIYTGWLFPAVISGIGIIRRERVEHIFSSAPRWTNHLVGLVLARVTGVPWTAHFRDPWTGIPRTKPESSLSNAIDGVLERIVVTRADAVVGVTDLQTSQLRRMYPELPPNKFLTIPNGFDEGEWEALTAGTPGRGAVRGDRFVIRYAGTLYYQRNPLPLFRALGALIDSHDVDPDKVAIDLMGWCDEAQGHHVKELAHECGVGKLVTVTGPLTRNESLRRMMEANLLLLLAEEQPYQIPGKTYEYLRAGRPILALTSAGATAELLRKTGGAWIIDPSDTNGIAAAVQGAYQHWNDGVAECAAAPDVVASFDRRKLAGRFAEVFQSTKPEIEA